MAQRREVVRRDLERVEEVVDVLDIDDRAQPTHRDADPLPQDRRLADPRVDDALPAVLRLESLVDEVHVAQDADVLAHDHDARIARHVRVEAAQQHDAPIDGFGVGREACGRRRDAQRRAVRRGHEVGGVAAQVLVAVAQGRGHECIPRRPPVFARRDERREHGGVDHLAVRIARVTQFCDERVGIDARLACGDRDDAHRLVALAADRHEGRFVAALAHRLDLGALALLVLVERRRVGDLRADHPLAHLADRIGLDLVAQSLGRLVALVTA